MSFTVKMAIDPYSPQMQKSARHSGEYDRVMDSLTKCPFCDLKDKYLIKRGQFCTLSVNLFPYIDGQLIVIPYRHFERLSEMSSEEWGEAKELIELGFRVLAKVFAVKDTNLILREGEQSQSSLHHYHINILPFKEGLITRNFQKIKFTPQEVAERLREAINS